MNLEAFFLNAFFEAVIETFKEFAHISLARNFFTRVPNLFSSQNVVLMMGLLGDYEGEIFLELPPQTALKVVSKIYGNIQFTSLDEKQVEPTLFELMARISGNALEKLRKKGFSLEISPVSIFQQKEVEFCIEKDIPVIKLTFTDQEEPEVEIAIYLALKKKKA